MTELPAHGAAWLEILGRSTIEGFSKAFTTTVILDGSAILGTIVGTTAIQQFFSITRTMYDQIAFVHEVSVVDRTCLEWEGTFNGHPIAGTTILGRDKSGAIDAIQLYHRPYSQVVAFSEQLTLRLDGVIYKRSRRD